MTALLNSNVSILCLCVNVCHNNEANVCQLLCVVVYSRCLVVMCFILSLVATAMPQVYSPAFHRSVHGATSLFAAMRCEAWITFLKIYFPPSDDSSDPAHVIHRYSMDLLAKFHHHTSCRFWVSQTNATWLEYCDTVTCFVLCYCFMSCDDIVSLLCIFYIVVVVVRCMSQSSRWICP